MSGGADAEDGPTDGETVRLVSAFQAGDREAFGEIYSRNFDAVYHYLRLLLNDRHAAEETAQQSFLQAFGALGRYELRPDRPFRAWLFTIVRNVALMRLRKEGRVEPVDPAELGRRRDRQVDPDTARDDAERAMGWIRDNELLMFVERLPISQRQVLVLRFMLDMSLDETAQVLGRSAADIGVLQHRALAFLRDRLTAVGRAGEKADRARARSATPQALVLRRRRFALLKR